MYVVYVCKKVAPFVSQLKCGLWYSIPSLKRQHTNIMFLRYSYNKYALGCKFLIFVRSKHQRKSREVQDSVTYLVSECES